MIQLKPFSPHFYTSSKPMNTNLSIVLSATLITIAIITSGLMERYTLLRVDEQTLIRLDQFSGAVTTCSFTRPPSALTDLPTTTLPKFNSDMSLGEVRDLVAAREQQETESWNENGLGQTTISATDETNQPILRCENDTN